LPNKKAREQRNRANQCVGLLSLPRVGFFPQRKFGKGIKSNGKEKKVIGERTIGKNEGYLNSQNGTVVGEKGIYRDWGHKKNGNREETLGRIRPLSVREAIGRVGLATPRRARTSGKREGEKYTKVKKL